jgi:Uma2 family endonuclease
MAQLAEHLAPLSVAEYLEGERLTDVRYELIDGEVYAMGGASGRHNLIAGNVFARLHQGLRGQPCKVYMSDMKVHVMDNFYYPDIMVACDQPEPDPYYREDARLLVEVLSKTTRQRDETFKKEAYLSIPSLEEYMLIEQDVVDVEVFRKSDNWRSQHYFLEDAIRLDSINMELPVALIYDDVAL